MVAALGVTADGTKVPLGVVEGSTENASVVRGLISDLRDRGLTAESGILFVLDGGRSRQSLLFFERVQIRIETVLLGVFITGLCAGGSFRRFFEG